MKFNKYFLLFILLNLLVLISSRGKTRKFSTERSKFLSRLSTREPRQDDDLEDITVVYSLMIPSHERKDITCPHPYKLAKSSCTPKSCDLNEGNGGNYAYLCIARKKLSELGANEGTINKLYLSINQNECGSLQKIGPLKNHLIGTDQLYVCWGNEGDEKPIEDIYVFGQGNNIANVPAGYKCEFNIADKKKFCIKRIESGPKSIEFTDIKFLPEEKAEVFGNPEFVFDMENDNGSGSQENVIEKSIAITKVESSSWNIENKFGTKIEVKVTAANLFVGKLGIAANLEMNWTRNSGETKTSTEVEEIKFKCDSPARKHYKCLLIMEKYNLNVPYTVNRIVTDYSGVKTSKIIRSNYAAILSKIRTERCCLNGCSETEYKCDSKIPVKTECPDLGVEKVQAPIEISTSTEKLKYNPKVLVSLSVIEGENTSCPYGGYEIVKCHDDNSKCDLNKGAGGAYLFLCAKYVDLDKTTSNSINIIDVQVNNKVCGGNLILSEMDLNKDAGGDYIYLCSGNDYNQKLAPIVDVKIAVNDFRSLIDDGYECNFNDVNSKAGGKDLYICYKRDMNVPKTIEIKNMQYDMANLKKVQIGNPIKVDETTVVNTSITKNVKSSQKVETSYKKIFDVGGSVSISVSLGDPKILEKSMSITGSYKRTSSEEIKQSSEYTETTTVNCAAKDGKTVKCISTITKYQLTVPYTAKLFAYDWLGREMTAINREITGTFVGLSSSSVSVRSCCVGSYCCVEGDVRSHCTGTGVTKDVVCADLEKCYNNKKVFKRRNKH